jgi:hypothetical protein
MSQEEPKSPYYSKRIRIGDITSPKDLIGLKEFTVEITYGNQDKIIIKNKQDVAEILQEKNMFDEVEEIFRQRDIWAAKRNLKFVDQKPKDES